MRSFILKTTVVLVLGLSPAMAQTIAGVDIQAMRAASESSLPAALETFSQILNAQNASQLGVSSSVNVTQAQIGDPVVEFVIGLAAVQSFQPGVDPVQLLGSNGRITYPLFTGGGNISSVSMTRLDQGWVAASFGSPVTTAAVVNARNMMVSDRGLPAHEIFQIRIPAMNLVFVAHLATGQIFMAPIVDYSGFQLLKGRVYPADMVLGMLVETARYDNGEPG